jgi:stage V sporulation protein B
MSTLILVIGGMLTKFLGFIIKIIYTRIIGEYAISLYMLVMPTYSLLITIASMALPIAISKLVAEGKNSIKLAINTSIIILFINFIIIFTIFLSADFIASSLLNEPKCKYLLIACSLTLPFISISSLIKGYFFGKQKVYPYAISNVLEQVIRLIIIWIVLPILIKKNVMYAVLGLILLSIISEISSIIIFLFFLPKNFTITKKDLIPNKTYIKDILNVCIPTVSSRIIGNIGFFFEPIILTNILIYCGYSTNYIITEYGAYNAYTLALLTMPGFFINALCQVLVPEISKYTNNKKMIKRRIIQSLSFSFIIGAISSLIIFIFRYKLLSIIYNTTSGVEYIKILAPVFVLFYLEAPLMSCLQAIGKSIITMKITTIGVIIKLLSLALLSLFHIGIYSLVFAEIINIFVVVLLNFYYLKKYIFN